MNEYKVHVFSNLAICEYMCIHYKKGQLISSVVIN